MGPLHVYPIILYNIRLYIYIVKYKSGIKNTWFSPKPFKKKFNNFKNIQEKYLN